MDTLNYRIKTKLPFWYEMKKDGFTQKGKGYYKNIDIGNCIVKLQASNLFGNDYLNVEFSAPKLIYGSNVEMIKPSDLEFLNDTLTDIVNKNTKIPFEANEAEITRLDLAHNWKTPSELNANAYRDAMKSVSWSKRMTRWICDKDFGTDTVYWSNKCQEIVIYPKYAETSKLAKKGKIAQRFLEQSRGMIRLEHRWLNSQVIKKSLSKFGYNNLAGELVPHLLEITKDIINEDMKTLGLDHEIELSGERERADKLRSKCGDNTEKFQSLLGFLNSCDFYGENNLVAMGLIKDGTFRTRKSELKAMGISLSKPQKRYLLPPLSKPNFEDEFASKPFNKTKLCSPQRNFIPKSENSISNMELAY